MPRPSDAVTAYLGLGGNLGDPLDCLRRARQAVIQIPGVQEIACSSFYRSAPMGPADQPEYVNAVQAIATTLPPLELLDQLQAIETAFGRVRIGERWGPRTLDLDILLYGQETLNLPRLIVPHVGVALREFVLYPLQEIAPELHIPGVGAVAELVRNCPRRGLEVIEHD